MARCHMASQRCFGVFIPQTGLALMGFSRYCPSSLDLTNFVVWRCRGDAAEVPRTVRRPAQVGPGLAQASVWEFGNLGTWTSRNLGSKNVTKYEFLKFKSVPPKMSARSGLVGNKSSWPHLGPSGPIFCVGRKNAKEYQNFATVTHDLEAGIRQLDT